jgi:ATPase subunit of ABC transporter with duplicated ATPase domains
MHLTPKKKLDVYNGNYATYVKTREEREVNQKKEYDKQEEVIKHIKKFISSCGTFANAVKQANSRQKVCFTSVTQRGSCASFAVVMILITSEGPACTVLVLRTTIDEF